MDKALYPEYFWMQRFVPAVNPTAFGVVSQFGLPISSPDDMAVSKRLLSFTPVLFGANTLLDNGKDTIPVALRI